MAKVTSKRQVTIPKAIADQYRIREGDDLEFVAAGDAIRVLPPGTGVAPRPVAARLALFDAATARQRARQRARPASRRKGKGRGWTRAELYDRGHAG
ncbi:MAG TPA: AbrB/MazE/SpoVT family DNA-binding domain-containing protein [Gemmatimonadales bacterium]|jgi:AbrB family looped-hinge helix DNA binding protein